MARVAVRGIGAHRFRLVATMLSVLLGVSFMCGTAILGDTVRASFDEVFADIYRDVDVVVRSDSEIGQGFGTRRDRVDALVVDEVRAVGGVAVAEGRVQGNLRVIDANGESMYNPQAGFPTVALNWPTVPELNGWTLVEGVPPVGPDQIVLDRRTAREGGYTVGDRVRLAAAVGTIDRELVGIGTFAGLDTYSGSPAVLLDTAAAQALVGEAGRFDAIQIVAEPGVAPDDLAGQVRSQLGDGTGLQVMTGEELTEESQSTFGQFVVLFTQLVSAFGAIALFVGMFIIYNTFTIIVSQRARELALLRAVGAARRQVLGSVLIEATVVGLVASALGVLAGRFVADLLRSLIRAFGFALPETPLQVVPSRFVLPVALAMGTTLVSAVIPAWRAARTSPVAAMREAEIERAGRPWLRVAIAACFAAGAIVLIRLAFDAADDVAPGLVLAAAVPAIVAFAVVGPVLVPGLVRVVGAPLPAATGITGRLAQRNARRNPSRTSTTASALVIGVSLVSVITVAASSLSATVTRTIDRTVVGDFVVTADSFLGISPTIGPALAAVDGVAAASGVRGGPVSVDGDDEFAIAVDPVAAQQIVDLEVRSGSLSQLGIGQVAVAAPQAERDGVQIGDVITVEFVFGGAVVDHEVVAIYDRSLTRRGEYLFSHAGWDTNVPETAKVDQRVLVTLEDGVDSAAIRPTLDAVLDAHPTAELADIAQYRDQQVGQVVQRISYLYALLGLALIIGLLGIANTLLLSVHERTRELGLLRIVGARRRQLGASVLQEASVIAALGALVGVALGVVLGWAMVQTLTFDDVVLFAVPVGWLVLIAVGSCAAGVVAGLYPAWRAGRLDVLDAIAEE
jgi:putative ABC transport system permease protein